MGIPSRSQDETQTPELLWDQYGEDREDSRDRLGLLTAHLYRFENGFLLLQSLAFLFHGFLLAVCFAHRNRAPTTAKNSNKADRGNRLCVTESLRPDR